MQLRWRAICQEGGDTEQSCALTTEGAEHLSKDDKDKDEGKNKDFEEHLAPTTDQAKHSFHAYYYREVSMPRGMFWIMMTKATTNFPDERLKIAQIAQEEKL